MQNTKHQTPNTKEAPNFKLQRPWPGAGLKFGAWCFFGIWCLVFGVSPSALACAACYGKSDSPMAWGMNAGIFTLLVVITGVLAGISGFFVYIARRAAKISDNGMNNSNQH